MNNNSPKKDIQARAKDILHAVRAVVLQTILGRLNTIRYAIVAIGVVVGTVLALLVYFGDSVVTVPEQRPIILDTEVADLLELVIEERQTTYENPPALPSSLF